MVVVVERRISISRRRRGVPEQLTTGPTLNDDRRRIRSGRLSQMAWRQLVEPLDVARFRPLEELAQRVTAAVDRRLRAVVDAERDEVSIE